MFLSIIFALYSNLLEINQYCKSDKMLIKPINIRIIQISNIYILYNKFGIEF